MKLPPRWSPWRRWFRRSVRGFIYVTFAFLVFSCWGVGQARSDEVGMYGNTWLGPEPPAYEQQAADGFYGCGSGQVVELPDAVVESVEVFVYGDEEGEWGSIDVEPGSASVYFGLYSEAGERVALTQGISIASMGEVSGYHVLAFDPPVEVVAGTYAVMGADVDPDNTGYFYVNKLWPGDDANSEEGSNRAKIWSGPCDEEVDTLESLLPENAAWGIASWGTSGLLLTFTPLESADEPNQMVEVWLWSLFCYGALCGSFFTEGWQV